MPPKARRPSLGFRGSQRASQSQGPRIAGRKDDGVTDLGLRRCGLSNSRRPAEGRQIDAHSVPLCERSHGQKEAARAILDISERKTKTDVRTRPRGRARVTGGQGASRRTRNVAAAMFAWGIEHALCNSNPFVGVTLARAPVRERFLTKEEAGRLLDAISTLESRTNLSSTFADALRLLLLTGARKTEVLGLRWKEVDLARSRLNLPPDRTKAGGKTGERRIQLSPPALEILLRRRQRSGGDAFGPHAAEVPTATFDYVFPAAHGEGHAVGLRRAFQKVCKEAELPGLRIHDLRHSFASFAVADGASLVTALAVFRPSRGRMWRLRFDASITQVLARFAGFVAGPSAKYRSIRSATVSAALAAFFSALGSSPVLARPTASAAALRASSGDQGDPCSPIV